MLILQSAYAYIARLDRARIFAANKAMDPEMERSDGGSATRFTTRLETGSVSELMGIVRVKLHEGKLDEFKRLSLGNWSVP